MSPLKTGRSWRVSAACELRKEEFPPRWITRGSRLDTCFAPAPLLTALLRFRVSLPAYAAHHGVPGLYNETITCFYMLLIRECIATHGGHHRLGSAFWKMNPSLFRLSRA